MRRLRDRGSARDNPSILDNPRWIPSRSDIGAGVEGTVGIVLTAFVHDKILSNFERPLVGAFKHSGNTVGQLVSAAGTYVASRLVGMAAGQVVSRQTADRLEAAGTIYAAAKGVTAFVPKLSVDAQYPDFWPSLGDMFGSPVMASAAPALPAGTSGALAEGGAPVVFTDNPRPVAAQSDVGW